MPDNRIVVRNVPDQQIPVKNDVPIYLNSTILKKTITENGTYRATEENANGFDPVVVNVPTYEAENAALTAEVAELTKTVAEKTAEIAQLEIEVGEVYEQGKIDGNMLQYATTLSNLFQRAVFPDGYEITIDAQNITNGMTYLFDMATGVRKITLNIPTAGINYNGNYAFYRTTIEELVLPDGIHFSSWLYFVSNIKTLKRVIGRIDPSGVANNLYTFNGCSSLEDVSFMPNTIDKAITFANSVNLSANAIQSIIDGLVDLTGQTPQTVTFHKNVGEKLTEEQKATITAKNWTLVY